MKTKLDLFLTDNQPREIVVPRGDFFNFLENDCGLQEVQTHRVNGRRLDPGQKGFAGGGEFFLLSRCCDIRIKFILKKLEDCLATYRSAFAKGSILYYMWDGSAAEGALFRASYKRALEKFAPDHRIKLPEPVVSLPLPLWVEGYSRTTFVSEAREGLASLIAEATEMLE